MSFKTTFRNIISRIKGENIDDTRRDNSFFEKSLVYINKEFLINKEVIFITIAFNDADLISLQINQIKKHVTGNYAHLIIDNSIKVKGAHSNAIYQVCKKQDMSYVKIPSNPKMLDPSFSHGFACNWAVKNILRHYNPKYICFIDHDIFPYKSFSVNYITKNQSFYGLKQIREDRWYLWPGFAIFDLSKIKLEHLDFLPIEGLDTGGGNWLTIFQKYNESYKYSSSRFLSIPGLEVTNMKQDYKVEIIDDCWVHLIGGSNWMNSRAFKRKYETIINDFTIFIDFILSNNSRC